VFFLSKQLVMVITIFSDFIPKQAALNVQMQEYRVTDDTRKVSFVYSNNPLCRVCCTSINNSPCIFKDKVQPIPIESALVIFIRI